ncbi:hypothetical protein PVAP13_5KG021700, partial [Panicum virgatum]
MSLVDVDGNLELSMQLDATPSSGGKGASKRGSNYSQEEDIQLCKSWISISNDAIVGTDQSSKTYWERITAHFHNFRGFHSDRTANSLEHHCGVRITAHFHNFRGFHSDRTANSLEHRCGVIINECMRFQSYYEEVERRHPSNVPYQEHILEAQARYAKASQGKSFTFFHCWLERPSKSKEINLSVGTQQGDGTQSPAKKARPPGQKQSKEKLKRNERGDEYKDMMGNLMAMKAEEVKLKKEKWEKDVMIEQCKLDIEERRLQWEEEQKIMFCDMSNMDEHQKAYVMAKRAQFAKAASASVGDTAS